MKLDQETINGLFDRFEKSTISRFELESEGSRLVMERNVPGGLPQAAVPALQASSSETAAPGPGTAGPEKGPSASGAAEDSPEKADEEGTAVCSPLAGTFYRAPKPGEKPYAEVGRKIRKGETVGLIEAMKIMSEIPAPADGIISKILLDDGAFAEYGTPLMIIKEEA